MDPARQNTQNHAVLWNCGDSNLDKHHGRWQLLGQILVDCLGRRVVAPQFMPLLRKEATFFKNGRQTLYGAEVCADRHNTTLKVIPRLEMHELFATRKWSNFAATCTYKCWFDLHKRILISTHVQSGGGSNSYRHCQVQELACWQHLKAPLVRLHLPLQVPYLPMPQRGLRFHRLGLCCKVWSRHATGRYSRQKKCVATVARKFGALIMFRV